MALIEMFSSSLLISVAAFLILCSVIFAYISYRMSEQDHKISSMLGLISTMAQELDFFRNKLATKSGGGPIPIHSQIPFHSTTSAASLIEVSDDNNEEDTDSYDDNNNPIKVLNINLGNEPSQILDISEDIKDLEDHNENEEDDEEEGDGDFSEVNSDSESSQSTINDNTKTIHLEETFINLDNSNDMPLDNNMSFLKTLHIDNLEELDLDQEQDYKKMSVQKLRSLAIEKGLSQDPSKLKKNELIKLFSNV